MRSNRIIFATVLLILGVLMTTPIYTAEQYIEDVGSGKVVACKWVKLAVQRHTADLERVGETDFPYHFDEAQAKRAIDFIQQLKHTKGEWANPRKHNPQIRLEPWQQFIVWNIFGWRDAEVYRRFNKVYLEVARKMGKTTFAASIANYCYLMDRPQEIGPEVYAIATKKDQAKIVWSEAERQLRAHHFLRKKVRTYKQSSTIVIPGTASQFRPLGQDSDTEDGLNPHCVIVDEYHAHPDNTMINVMESGMGARRQPLTFIITTAGFDKNSACYQEERTLTTQILAGELDPVPENYFGIIYTLDDGDDWTDPEVWIKSNPNLGVSVRWKYIEERVQIALHSPRKQNDVKTKNLNIWTQAETRWIDSDVWGRGSAVVNEVELKGRPCYVGVDLSANQDITAVVYDFPPSEPEERYKQVYRFFIPGDNIIEKTRKDRVPYDIWIEKGLVIPTPGDVVDYDFIEQTILQDAENFEILEIAYDPWKAQEIVNHLTESGFTMIPIYQRYSGMAAFTDAFEKAVLGAQIQHGGNPVMQWMISCTEVKSDRQGNIMPMKPRREKTGKRIDGVVASIMAHGRAVANNGEGGSVYETRGVIGL
jgi:phage terminase large subunit-like protein